MMDLLYKPEELLAISTADVVEDERYLLLKGHHLYWVIDPTSIFCFFRGRAEQVSIASSRTRNHVDVASHSVLGEATDSALEEKTTISEYDHRLIPLVHAIVSCVLNPLLRVKLSCDQLFSFINVCFSLWYDFFAVSYSKDLHASASFYPLLRRFVFLKNVVRFLIIRTNKRDFTGILNLIYDTTYG